MPALILLDHHSSLWNSARTEVHLEGLHIQYAHAIHVTPMMNLTTGTNTSQLQTKGAVHFNEQANTVHVIEKWRRAEVDHDDNTTCWSSVEGLLHYSQEEFDLIRLRDKLLVECALQAGHFLESEQFSFRGLEHYFQRTTTDRERSVIGSIHAVVHYGVSAEAYKHETRYARIAALSLAQQDAIDATCDAPSQPKILPPLAGHIRRSPFPGKATPEAVISGEEGSVEKVRKRKAKRMQKASQAAPMISIGDTSKSASTRRWKMFWRRGDSQGRGSELNRCGSF